MQYETCSHVHESGACCGSPKLRDSKYCYYHLTHRGRRLRRARALRESVPFRLDLPPIHDLDSAQFALSEITLALGDGQLDQRVAGKMLYAIQQLTSLLKFRAKLAAAQAGAGDDTTTQAPPAQPSPVPEYVQEYPAFARDYGLGPGDDIDEETQRTLRQAQEADALRQVHNMPEPPVGVRMGSAQYKVYRDEAYRIMNMQLNHMRHELRDYYEEKNKKVNAEIEQMKKEMASAQQPPEPAAKTA